MSKRPIFEAKPDLRNLAMRLAKLGLYQKTVADWLGVNEDTITRHKQRDPEFAEAFEHGVANARSLCLAKLIEQVQAGNVTAIKYYLNAIRGMSEHHKVESNQPLIDGRTVNLIMPDNGKRNDQPDAPGGAADRLLTD